MLVLCDYEGLGELIKNSSGVICFGLSDKILSQLECIDGVLFDKVSYLLDNSEKKQGKCIVIRRKKFIVESVETFYQKQLNGAVVLIGCRNYWGVIEQLDRYDFFADTKIVSLELIDQMELDKKAYLKTIPCNLHISTTELIPRKIHYCWFGGNELPDIYKEYINSWKKYCPDYEIIRWDEQNYDISKSSFMKEAYSRKKWGFVADYARIDIIYKYGGIYLDTDVELIKGLDDLLYQEAFMGFETGNKVATGLGFGATAGNKIIRETLDYYDKLQFINPDGTENLITCPIIQTNILKKHGLVDNGEYQLVDNVTIYPEKMLCGKSMYTMQINTAEYTRAIHHYDGSWSEDIWRQRNNRLKNALKV